MFKNSSTYAFVFVPVFALFAVLHLSIIGVNAQLPGSADLGFGNEGLVNTPALPGCYQGLNDLVIQPDGKILAVGWTAINGGNAVRPRFMLRRYNPDGTVDETFANAGIMADWLGIDSRAHSAAVLSGGGIVVAGVFGNDLALIRYSSNGIRRMSFGGSKGVQIFDLAETGQTSDDIPRKIVARSNGGFLVVSVRNSYPTGTSPHFAQSSIVVTAHNSYGMLDPTYAAGGKFVVALPYHNYNIFNVKVEEDGTMFVHANGSDRNDPLDPYYQPPSENLILKLGPNGLPDSTFGKNGKLHSTTSAVNRVLRVFPDGSLLASNRYRVVKMNRSGHTEAEIIDSQQITVNGQPFMKRSYLAQADGKIIAQGIIPDVGWALAFVRFLPTGEIDTTFGTAGLAPADAASFMGEHTFRLQNDGKILHADFGTNFATVLSRYHGGQ